MGIFSSGTFDSSQKWPKSTTASQGKRRSSCASRQMNRPTPRPSYSRRGRHWRRLAFASTLPHPTLPQPTFAKPTTFISRIYVQHSVQRVQGPDRPDRPLRTTTLHTFCYVVTSEWQCSDPPGHSLQVAVCGAAVLCFEGRRVRRVGLPGGEARGAGGTSGGSPPRSLARSSEPSSSNQPSIP